MGFWALLTLLVVSPSYAQDARETVPWTHVESDPSWPPPYLVPNPLNPAEPASVCHGAISPVADLEAALRRIQWDLIRLHGVTSGGDSWFGYNFRSDASCQRYPGGQEALSRVIRTQMQQLFSCFQGLGPARRNDLARLAALFEGGGVDIGGGRRRGLEFRCLRQDADTMGSGESAGFATESDGFRFPVTLDRDSIALAHFCLSSFPGVSINIDAVGRSAGRTQFERHGTVAHEVLHLLGYEHHSGVDVPYLAEYCCFPEASRQSPNRAARTEACNLLRRERQDTSTAEYARAFGRILGPDMSTVFHTRFDNPGNRDQLVHAYIGAFEGQRPTPSRGLASGMTMLAAAHRGNVSESVTQAAIDSFARHSRFRSNDLENAIVVAMVAGRLNDHLNYVIETGNLAERSPGFAETVGYAAGLNAEAATFCPQLSRPARTLIHDFANTYAEGIDAFSRNPEVREVLRRFTNLCAD